MASRATIGTMVVNIVANTLGMSRGLKNVTKQARVFGGSIKGMTGLLRGVSGGFIGMAGAAVAAGLAVRSMFKRALDFQRSMATSTAIMGKLTSDQTRRMGEEARRVAAVTKFSSAEVAKSYFFLASAGFDAEQSIQAVAGVARFAQAGMFDLSTATSLLTDAVSALGLKVDDATERTRNMARVGDVLVRANQLADASVEQFSRALTTRSAAAFRVLGLSVEEAVAALAVLADQGVKAEDAGTKLGIVMRDLGIKALKNADAFKEAGIEVFSSTGAFRSLGDILIDLDAKLGKLSPRGKTRKLLSLGFSDRNMKTLLLILDRGPEINRMLKELEEGTGSVAEVASKNLTELDKALNKMGATIDRLSSGVMDPAIESTSNLMAGIDMTARQLGGLTDRWETIAAILSFGIVPALSKVLELSGAAAEKFNADEKRRLDAEEGAAKALRDQAAGKRTAPELARDRALENLFSVPLGGATPPSLSMMEAIQEKQEELAKQAEAHVAKMDALMSSLGDSVRSDVESPIEAAARQTNNLMQLWLAGEIGVLAFGRALKKVKGEQADAIGQQVRAKSSTGTVGALKAGSVAAFSARNKANRETQIQTKIQNAIKIATQKTAKLATEAASRGLDQININVLGI